LFLAKKYIYIITDGGLFTMKEGNKFGNHRVIEPKGSLPQPAWKLDNNMGEIYDN